MTIEAMQDYIKTLGLKRTFRPEQEAETGTVLLKTRRPAQIVDGLLAGSEIAIYGRDLFRVWTSRKTKAATMARAHNLRVRLLTGEAELFVPARLADKILPVFGAKTRRDLTPAQVAVLRARMALVRKGRDAAPNPEGTLVITKVEPVRTESKVQSAPPAIRMSKKRREMISIDVTVKEKEDENAASIAAELVAEDAAALAKEEEIERAKEEAAEQAADDAADERELEAEDERALAAEEAADIAKEEAAETAAEERMLATLDARALARERAAKQYPQENR